MSTVRLSLRTWLLALSLLSTLPLLMLSMSTSWDHKLYRQEVVVEQLEQRAHDLSRTGEPWLLVDRLGRLRDWFAYWLKP